MDELIKTFHVDWKLLIAQAVNFAVVLLVLYKFAYRPILKTLNDRTKKIEKGIRDAEEAGKKLSETEEKEKEILKTARKEAQAIIASAEGAARRNKEEIAGEARKQAEEILKTAERKIEEEKDKMLKEAKKELADLVILATEKIIKEKLDKEKDEELIKKALK